MPQYDPRTFDPRQHAEELFGAALRFASDEPGTGGLGGSDSYKAQIQKQYDDYLAMWTPQDISEPQAPAKPAAAPSSPASTASAPAPAPAPTPSPAAPSMSGLAAAAGDGGGSAGVGSAADVSVPSAPSFSGLKQAADEAPPNKELTPPSIRDGIGTRILPLETTALAGLRRAY